MTVNEAKLRSIINKSVRKAINEIGDTPKGQNKLGRLTQRLEKDGRQKEADDVHSYAKAEQDKVYGNLMDPKAQEKGNQMTSAYLKGRDKDDNRKSKKSKKVDENVIRLSESEFRNMINESVQRVLSEISSDMIGRAKDKFYQKYGGSMFPGPEAKDFPRDEHGNLLYPKDMKPLADHYRKFNQAYKDAKYNEQFDDPLTKEAMDIWNEYESDVDWEITDDFGNEGCEVGGWLEVNGWEFSASGYAEKAGGLDVQEIESVEFKSPDGEEGSFRP